MTEYYVVASWNDAVIDTCSTLARASYLASMWAESYECGVDVYVSINGYYEYVLTCDC